MTLRELYPYWSDTHEEIIERLEILSDLQWNARPCYIEGGSIRQIVLRFIRFERFWIQEIAQRREPEPIIAQDLPTPIELIALLRATREATAHYLGTLTLEGLRAVRTAPGNPATNEMERNVPLSWVLWNVMEQELIAWGQIQLRLSP